MGAGDTDRRSLTSFVEPGAAAAAAASTFNALICCKPSKDNDILPQKLGFKAQNLLRAANINCN